MSKSFWKTDWFIGVVVSVVVLFAGGGELLQSLERKAYDLGVGAVSREPSDKIAVIAIDKQSVDNLGRWPWSREVHAKMVDGLAASKAKVIASTIFFSEPQIDAVECAFSDQEMELAKVSRHLCPQLLAEGLRSLDQACDVFITHLKPGEIERTMLEIERSLGEFSPGMLQNNQLLTF